MLGKRSLLEALLSRIKSGLYPVGSTIPTEMELCKEFTASRYAVREAIRHLQDLGMVERRQRVGTTVLRRWPEQRFGLELETTDKLQRYLEFTDLHVIEVTETLTDHPPEALLEGDIGDWMKMATYRSVPNTVRAISYTDIYLRKEHRDIIEHVSRVRGGIYPLFEMCYGEVVEVIEVEISATRFPKPVAKLLKYAVEDPALQVIRSFRNADDRLLEIAVSYYPPYEFRYTTRLGREHDRHKVSF